MSNNPASHVLEPRRMIPGETDILSHIFAGLGVEEFNKFNKFNKLHPEDYDDGAPIGDSYAATPTVTSHENQEGAKPSDAVRTEEHVDEDGDETKTTTTTTTYSTLTSSAASAGDSASATKGSKWEDAAEDTEGFAETLFEMLRKKFREALNSSDEVLL
ncbi:hypothetical protein BJY01DRAFT_252195 [Aspergillus pseudoustus]|uniref:Uncharacterized protein n=1 Tax=Aspergillus pseudoustus TaxID=1810923 RepID=A0ABR4J7F9_9EURO